MKKENKDPTPREVVENMTDEMSRMAKRDAKWRETMLSGALRRQNLSPDSEQRRRIERMLMPHDPSEPNLEMLRQAQAYHPYPLDPDVRRQMEKINHTARLIASVALDPDVRTQLKKMASASVPPPTKKIKDEKKKKR